MADSIVPLLAEPLTNTIEETNLALVQLAKVLRRLEPLPSPPIQEDPEKYKVRQTRVLQDTDRSKALVPQ